MAFAQLRFSNRLPHQGILDASDDHQQLHTTSAVAIPRREPHADRRWMQHPSRVGSARSFRNSRSIGGLKHGTTTLRGRDRTLRQPVAKTEANRYEANAGFLSAIPPKLETLGLICDLSFNPKSSNPPPISLGGQALCSMSHKTPLLDEHASSPCDRNHKHEKDTPPSRLLLRSHSQAFFARSAPLRLVGGGITELTTRNCGSTTRSSAPESLSASKQNMFSPNGQSAELHRAPFAWTAASDKQRFGESPAACHVSTTAHDRTHAEACLCTHYF
jgi:hypothetical protein